MKCKRPRRPHIQAQASIAALCYLSTMTAGATEAATCNAEGTIVHGDKGNCTAALTNGATCVPTCDYGYTLSGRRTCGGNGTLVDTARCDANMCSGSTPIPPHSTVGTCSLPLRTGETCMVTCDGGYAGGSVTFRCEASGKYSGKLSCTPKRCTWSDGPLPTGGGLRMKEQHAPGKAGYFPSMLFFTCKNGQVAGDSNWVCSNDTCTGDTCSYISQTSPDAKPSSVQCTSCPAITHCPNANLQCDEECDRCCDSWLGCGCDRSCGCRCCTCRRPQKCNRCEPGYGVKTSSDGLKDTCPPVECPALAAVLNGSITYTVDGQRATSPLTFSGSKSDPKTLATITCNPGFLLTYDDSGLPATSAVARKCTVDDGNKPKWTEKSPTCEATCSVKPCVSSIVDGQQVDHFSQCYDGNKDGKGATQKFRCTCKLGWQGERCEQDVNECHDTEYTTLNTKCEELSMCLPGDVGCTPHGFAVELPLTCAVPYWVDMKTHFPSGCDRDTNTNELLTECNNLPGTWQCGGCKEIAACCTAVNAANLPTLSPAVNTPWHTSTQQLMCEPVLSGVATINIGHIGDCVDSLYFTWRNGTSTGYGPGVGSTVQGDGATFILGGSEYIKRVVQYMGCGYNLHGGFDFLLAGDLGNRNVSVRSHLDHGPEVSSFEASAGQQIVGLNFTVSQTSWSLTGVYYVPNPRSHTAACSKTSQAWQSSGCTGIASGPYSVLKILQPKSRCRTTDDMCACDGSQFPKATNEKCAGAGDHLTLSIDPRDQFGRVSGENGVTDTSTFQIGLSGKAGTEGLTSCSTAVIPTVVWEAVSQQYTANFGCHVAGRYVLSVQSGASLDGSPFYILILPSIAVPSNTIAFLDDDPRWCVRPGEATMGGAPRCRTMPGLVRTLLIKVRDVYGNERRRYTGKQNADQVLCSTGYVATGTLIKPASEVGWSIDNDAYRVDLTFTDPIEYHFWVKMSVNGQTWNNETSQNVQQQVSLWSYTQFVYALRTNLNSTTCADRSCLFGEETQDQCVQAGCLWSSGVVNQLQIFLDWLPDTGKHVKITLQRYCLHSGDPQGNHYWNRYYHASRCSPLDAWNATTSDIFQTTSPVWHSSTEFYRNTGTVNLTFTHPGLFLLKVELGGSNVSFPLSYHGSWPMLNHPHPLISIGPDLASMQVSNMTPPILQRATTTSGSSVLSRLDLERGDEYRFQMQSVDSNGNPRFGRDEVVIEFSRVTKAGLQYMGENDRRAARSIQYQPSDTYNLTAMTGRLCTLTKCTHKLIPYGTDHGVYDFTQVVTEYGVMTVSLWLCDIQNARKCLSGHPERARFRLHPSNFTFTVCPQNSNATDIERFDVTTNVLRGAQLGECVCKPGFKGTTGIGETCRACEKGTFTNKVQSTSCIDCKAGTACGCTIGNLQVDRDNCTERAWSPACATCSPCQSGSFQSKEAKSFCSVCKDGFQCPISGMTFPIAEPGFWVDRRQPGKAYKCKPGGISGACPGTSLFQSDLDSGRGALGKPTKDQVKCYTEHHQGGFGSRDPCLDIIGSRCNNGYAGDKCGRCCKQADAAAPSCDGNMWYHSNGYCTQCEAQSGFLVTVVLLVLTIILGPILFQVAALTRHLGSLSAPLMSIVNFFQTADLFANLDLHWPESWKYFIHYCASLFNFRLPQWMSFVNPECSFSLTYFEKFILTMLSPFILVLTMVLAVVVRHSLCKLAQQLLLRIQLAQTELHENVDNEITPQQEHSSRLSLRVFDIVMSESVGVADGTRIEMKDTTDLDMLLAQLGQKLGLTDVAVVFLDPEFDEWCSLHSIVDLPDAQHGPLTVRITVPTVDAPSSASMTTETSSEEESLRSGRCSLFVRLYHRLRSPVGRKRLWLSLLHNLAKFDQEQLLIKMKSIILVYLMVGFVALISTALAPFGCLEVYGEHYMSAQPTIECNWCGAVEDVAWRFGNVGYAWLATLGCVFSVIYGAGIPLLLWSIIYTYRNQLKHQVYTERFGFLSNKMREGPMTASWEVVIIVRKLLLAVFTIQSGGHTVRGSLMNMLVLFGAAFLHFQYRPFAQHDANLAEGFTLVSTVLVLVVGLGQQAVLGPTSRIVQQQVIDVDDDHESFQMDLEAMDTFNYMCYFIMFFCISFTIIVILRRAGMAKFLYQHKLNLNRRLDDVTLDMIDKSQIDNTNAWAGISASEDELRDVKQIFESIRNFQATRSFMHSAGLEAWHGAITKHLSVTNCEQLQAITDTELRAAAQSVNVSLSQNDINDILKAIRAQADRNRLKVAQENRDDDVVVALIQKYSDVTDQDTILDELTGMEFKELVLRARTLNADNVGLQYDCCVQDELRPVLHAWMSWAEPQEVSILDSFVRSLHLINKEQIYAAWPACLRRRLIKAAKVNAIDRQSMWRMPSESGTGMELSSLDSSTSAEPQASSRSSDNVSTSDLRRSLLDLNATKERRELDKAQYVVFARYRWRFMSFLTRHKHILLAITAVGVPFAFGSFMFLQNAGCCPDSLEESWVSAGFDAQSCAGSNIKREHGSRCVTRCRDGYKETMAHKEPWQCSDNWFNPSWQPHNSSTARCEVDGCFVADSVEPCHTSGNSALCGCKGKCMSDGGGDFSCICRYSHGPQCKQCDLGRTGDECEIVICASSPCQNGGTCIPLPEGTNAFDGPVDGEPMPNDQNRRCGHICGGNDTTSAMCRESTTDGQLQLSLAEIKLRCTMDSTCVGFGQCIGCRDDSDYANGSYTYFRPMTSYTSLGHDLKWKTWQKHAYRPTRTFQCQCPAGYSGTICEVDPCAGNDCNGHGTCVVDGSGGKCACLEGWSGEMCNDPTGCSTTDPCGNHGICTADGGSHTCDCHEGYSGTSCNHDPCADVSCGEWAVCRRNPDGLGHSCDIKYRDAAIAVIETAEGNDLDFIRLTSRHGNFTEYGDYHGGTVMSRETLSKDEYLVQVFQSSSGGVLSHAWAFVIANAKTNAVRVFTGYHGRDPGRDDQRWCAPPGWQIVGFRFEDGCQGKNCHKLHGIDVVPYQDAPYSPCTICPMSFVVTGSKRPQFNGVYAKTKDQCNGQPKFQLDSGSFSTTTKPTTEVLMRRSADSCIWIVTNADTAENCGTSSYMTNHCSGGNTDCDSPDCAGTWEENTDTDTCQKTDAAPWCPNPGLAVTKSNWAAGFCTTDHGDVVHVGVNMACAYIVSGAPIKYNGAYKVTTHVCMNKPVYQQDGGDGYVLLKPNGHRDVWDLSTSEHATSCRDGAQIWPRDERCPNSPGDAGCVGKWTNGEGSPNVKIAPEHQMDRLAASSISELDLGSYSSSGKAALDLSFHQAT